MARNICPSDHFINFHFIMENLVVSEFKKIDKNDMLLLKTRVGVGWLKARVERLARSLLIE